MKLRVRIKRPFSRTVVVDVPIDDCTHLRDLRRHITSALMLPDSFNSSEAMVLTLNGLDPLCGEDCDLQSDLGLVNGDLVYVELSSAYSELLSETLREEQQQQAGPSHTRPDPVPCGMDQSQDVPDDDQKHNFYTDADMGPKSTETLNSGSDKKDFRRLDTDSTTTLETVNATTSKTLTAGATASEPASTSSDVEMIPAGEVNRYLKQCVLIREMSDSDGVIPASLSACLQSGRPQSPGQALFLVLHTLMMEVGYVLNTESKEDGLPAALHHGGPTYSLTYSYPLLNDTRFRLIGMSMGGTHIIYGSLREDANQRQLKVKVTDYVSAATSGAFTFRKLARLSRDFKDAVAYALLQTATKDTDLAVPSLTFMFYEIKLRILQNLDACSLLRLGQTCKTLHETCQTPQLWYRLFVRQFGKRYAMSHGADLNQDWLMLYKEHHKRCLETKRLFQESTVVVPPGINQPFPPAFGPPGWVPPFGIGGDYDREPAFMDPFPRRGLDPVRPRFDPLGPLPDHRHAPGTGTRGRDRSRPFVRPGRMGPLQF